MARPDRNSKILKILKKAYPQADCALVHENPFQLLVSTILSAQCTDKRVNLVTKTLYRKYSTPGDFASADLADLEREIRSTGFFRQKSRWIKAAREMLVREFEGKVPKRMEDLLKLPGVARKTANVVLGTAYGVSAGVVVDTHVKRIAKKLGLTRQTDPVKVEADLVRMLPRKDWIWFSHAVITHGRALCKAVKPLCPKCPLNRVCPSAELS